MDNSACLISYTLTSFCGVSQLLALLLQTKSATHQFTKYLKFNTQAQSRTVTQPNVTAAW